MRVSKGLDPYQDRHSVGPDLGPNCFQRLSADDKSLLTFFKINFFKKIFQEHYQSVKHLDLDQDQHSVGPDLGPNCSQRLSADDKITFIKRFFQEHYQSVKRFGSRSGPTECRS